MQEVGGILSVECRNHWFLSAKDLHHSLLTINPHSPSLFIDSPIISSLATRGETSMPAQTPRTLSRLRREPLLELRLHCNRGPEGCIVDTP